MRACVRSVRGSRRAWVLLEPLVRFEHGVKVFAWRPIAVDEEITIDYRLNAFDGDSWPCACGSRTCTGTVVGSFFAMDPMRQALLVPHAPTFIQREYRQRGRPW